MKLFSLTINNIETNNTLNASYTKNNLKLNDTTPVTDCYGTPLEAGDKVVVLLRYGYYLAHYLCKDKSDNFIYLTSFIRFNRIYYHLSYSQYTPIRADWINTDKDVYNITTNKVLSDISQLDLTSNKLLLEISPDDYYVQRT